ncbi:uncharacterized protein [Argopecten irradians]|uniref:uncharacterized protein isoform X2 n=1 Tax=Argopecten irradians TaxID=31199 RepID=UPI00372136D8
MSDVENDNAPAEYYAEGHKDEDDHREHVLTEKAEQVFLDRCTRFQKGLDKIWGNIEDIIIKKGENEQNLNVLKALEKKILRQKDEFIEKYEEFAEFLSRTNTKASKAELANQVKFSDRATTVMNNVIKDLKARKLEVAESMSLATSSSDTSTVILKKRLKAEAERTKLLYAKKKTELMKKKAASTQINAEIDADLHLLKQETETAVAEAEVKAAQNFELEERGLPAECVDRLEATREFVESQNVTRNDTPLPRPPPLFMPTPRPQMSFEHEPTLNPYVPAFRPVKPPPVHQTTSFSNSPPQRVVSDFTNFLIRKDLLFTRFTSFDDRPETFSSWKMSFRSIIGEMNLSAVEEWTYSSNGWVRNRVHTQVVSVPQIPLTQKEV